MDVHFFFATIFFYFRSPLKAAKRQDLRTMSRPTSGRRSARGQTARVSIRDLAFAGRDERAQNMFPNPLFHHSNNCLASARSGAESSRPSSAVTRQHSATSAAIRFARSPETARSERRADEDGSASDVFGTAVIVSPRGIRTRLRQHIVEMPLPSSTKQSCGPALDVLAHDDGGEHAQPCADGACNAVGTMEQACELKAGARPDVLGLQEHVRLLGDTGRIITTKHNPIRDVPQYQQAFSADSFGPKEWFPNSWDTVQRLPRSDPVSRAQTRQAPAGAYHPNLSLWGGMINGGPTGTSLHYNHQTARMSEEERRKFLITGERTRRHASTRMAKTDTLGLSSGGWGGCGDEDSPLSSTRGGSCSPERTSPNGSSTAPTAVWSPGPCGGWGRVGLGPAHWPLEPFKGSQLGGDAIENSVLMERAGFGCYARALRLHEDET